MVSEESNDELLGDDNERKYRAPALEKGLDILELLSRNGAPMTTSQMATKLGRSVSELFRMVLALEFRGYIESFPEGYSLTNKLFTLGLAQGAARSLQETALPVMKEIVRDLGQSCHLVIPSGDQIIVVARIESPMEMGFSVRVGYRRRLVDSSSGVILYGYATRESQARWLPQLRSSTDTERMERFLQKAEAVLERGYIQAPNDFVDSVTDLCVPILGSHGAVAALIVPYIPIKGQLISHANVIEKLKFAARKIGDALSNEGR